jgi:hypothetical protein
MKNRFFALLELALEQCWTNIRSIFYILVGILTSICAIGIFFLLNMFSFREFVTSNGITIYEDGAILTSSGMALISINNALFNTICTLVFLAIVLILVEYTVTFCRIAYIYDNESWDLVNVPAEYAKKFHAALIAFTAPNDKTRMTREVNDITLRVAILAVKNPEKGYTDNAIPDITTPDRT